MIGAGFENTLDQRRTFAWQYFKTIVPNFHVYRGAETYQQLVDELLENYKDFPDNFYDKCDKCGDRFY